MTEQANLRKSYSLYIKTAENPADSKTYLLVAQGFIKFMMKKLFEGNDIKLGAKLGGLGIRGRKVTPVINSAGEIKGVAPNWAETKKLWDSNPEAKAKKQLVYCFNEHTNGLIYNIVWRKHEEASADGKTTRSIQIKNKSYYSLRFSRDNKRTLSNLVKEGKEYMEAKARKRKF